MLIYILLIAISVLIIIKYKRERFAVIFEVILAASVILCLINFVILINREDFKYSNCNLIEFKDGKPIICKGGKEVIKEETEDGIYVTIIFSDAHITSVENEKYLYNYGANKYNSNAYIQNGIEYINDNILTTVLTNPVFGIADITGIGSIRNNFEEITNQTYQGS